MTADLFALTARLRRAMPRNPDVVELCDQAERLARELRAVVSTRCGDVASTGVVSTVCAECQRRRDAKARAMRKWRSNHKRKAA
jgi:hypothetical protein